MQKQALLPQKQMYKQFSKVMPWLNYPGPHAPPQRLLALNSGNINVNPF